MTTAHEEHGVEHDLGHHGSPFVQHHYDDAQHQFDSGKFGIWLFLAQEVLFFSALFVQYVLYRVHHSEIFNYAHKWLDVKFGATNTAVLIFSSLTAAWAVRCAQRNQRRGLIACIVITLLCACTFLGIKYLEYSHKVHEHILFGRYFDPCISPGNAELLTQNNECPGTKSTIDWDYGSEKAKTGCFEESKIDVDPNQPGVQADCAVAEITREKKTIEDQKTHKEVETWVEKSRRVIAARCPEPHLPEAGVAEHGQFPCWRPAYQPVVCPDLTDAEARRHGTAGRPQDGILVEYGDSAERGEDIVIDATCKAPAPATAQSIELLASNNGEHDLKEGQGAIHPIHIATEEDEFERASLGPPPEHTGMFLTIYFAMTGLHGIHVLFGIFVFTWLLMRSIKGHFTPEYFGPVDYAALYWHIVDIIWIFLFPLLYLIH
jgi:cytochrome c oxidase subunit 3